MFRIADRQDTLSATRGVFSAAVLPKYWIGRFIRHWIKQRAIALRLAIFSRSSQAAHQASSLSCPDFHLFLPILHDASSVPRPSRFAMASDQCTYPTSAISLPSTFIRIERYPRSFRTSRSFGERARSNELGSGRLVRCLPHELLDRSSKTRNAGRGAHMGKWAIDGLQNRL